MFLVFITLFLLVFGLINLYISRALIDKLDISARLKRYFRYFLAINFLGIVGYLLARYAPESVPNALFFLLSLPIGVLFILFCTTLLYHLSHTLFGRLPLSTQRRHFFKKSLDIGSLLVAFGVSAKAVDEARTLVIEKLDVKLNRLTQPYRIAQLSDVHIGGLIDQAFIHTVVQKSNRLDPDIVVITGDLVDVALPHAHKALTELTQLQSRYGTYFVVGNHEYLHDVRAIIAAVKELGITVLENDSCYIGDKGHGFNLAGVYDVMGYRMDTHLPDIDQALSTVDPQSPTVLLAHQPRFIDEVPNAVDLMLSGHTHGGQIYPFRALVKMVQPYIEGLHQHTENLQIYVNRGTGFWGPPMRLGASSEITLLRLIPS
ncbi:MAG TPA: metallophosphoesterase [Campylobacterales bacterium]|nr:metallophosphoesterase [Campylobacterales bacterium]